ncbi:uncharacterized protein LOC135331245 [Halichondria panicea]|uniref:uncharacterized protein LOC135331245 n=1 Tax=Halichondria panicea TaxID=6063 RepID=UPI00312B9D5A
MSKMKGLKLLLMFAIVLVVVEAKKTSRLVLVSPDSTMEKDLVSSFKEQGFDEVDMINMRDYGNEFQFRYKIITKQPIWKAYLILPQYVYLNGSVRYFEEFRDFRIFCKRRSVIIESKRVGLFHVSVLTKRNGQRGKRALAVDNMILNAGMTTGCQNVCDAKKKTCPKESSKHLPPATLECPPNNECNIISHDASIYNTSSGIVVQPIGNAQVVKTCDEFIKVVMDKFAAKGGKVAVYLDAHGNHGIFAIGVYGGKPELVFKGSACYNKMCMELKDKISTLTLFTCSTAGGTTGPPFLQCLANCLNANVKAWKKAVSIQAAWNTTDVTSIKWSTPRNYSTPCEANPSPSPSITPSTPTPTPTPSTPTPSPSTTTTSTPTSSSTYTFTSEPMYSEEPTTVTEYTETPTEYTYSDYLYTSPPAEDYYDYAY